MNSKFGSNYVRLVHEDDTVPHIPPRGTTFSAACRFTGWCTYSPFTQAGYEVWFYDQQYDEDNYIECKYIGGTEENQDCSNGLYDWVGLAAHKEYLGMKFSD